MTATAVPLVLVSTAGIAVAAAVGAALVTLLLAWLGSAVARRSPPTDEEWVASAVYDLDHRLEAMRREVALALEHAREETRRSRHLGEVATSIDLDEVLRRTLDAAGAIAGADAAMIGLDAEPEPVQSWVGLSPEEAQEYAFGHQPPGRRTRVLSLAFEQPPEPAGETPPLAVALAVPIPGEAEPLGLLTVFSRGDPNVFSEEQVRELEALAVRAGPAIENAMQFREARQLADLDGLTGLHNRRYFHETLAREVARAQRYTRRLALLVLDLDNLKQINDRLGHLAGDAVLAEVAQRMREVVRAADIPCRIGGDEFAVILPESGLDEADQLYRRVQGQIADRPAGETGTLSFSAGIAELSADDDAVVFFRRADEALYRAKQAGRGRVATAPPT